MSINLQEELLKIKEVSNQNTDNAVKEVKLLLAGDESKDLEIIRFLAPNSKLVKHEEQLGRKIEHDRLDAEYGDVFTSEQIKSLAIKYRLRFLPSNMYHGTLPVTTVSKLKEFAKEKKVSLDQYTMSRNFFILAPAESFKLLEREKDPILFYKLNDGHYRMIDKWGDDFSFTRLIIGLANKNQTNRILANHIIASALALVIPTLFVLINALAWHFLTIDFMPTGVVIGVGLFVFTVINIITLAGIDSDCGRTDIDSQYTQNNWDDQYTS